MQWLRKECQHPIGTQLLLQEGRASGKECTEKVSKAIYTPSVFIDCLFIFSYLYHFFYYCNVSIFRVPLAVP